MMSEEVIIDLETFEIVSEEELLESAESLTSDELVSEDSVKKPSIMSVIIDFCCHVFRLFNDSS